MLQWEGKVRNSRGGELPSPEAAAYSCPAAHTRPVALQLSSMPYSHSFLSQKLESKEKGHGTLCLAWAHAACRQPVPGQPPWPCMRSLGQL